MVERAALVFNTVARALLIMSPMILWLILTSVISHANVQYRSTYVYKAGQKFTEYWQDSRTFCFRHKKQEKICEPIHQIRELRVRDQAQWLTALNLSPLQRGELEVYDRIYLRIVHYGPNNEFAILIHFNGSKGLDRFTHTIFAFGANEEIKFMSMGSFLEELRVLFWLQMQTPLADSGDDRTFVGQILDHYEPLLFLAQTFLK